MLIYAGLEHSELASASAKHKQLIAAVFGALLAPALQALACATGLTPLYGAKRKATSQLKAYA